MILMHFREMRRCPEHHHAIILLEEVSGHRTLAVAADRDESARLWRELGRRSEGTHPIYDFVDKLLQTFGVAPARVVLEYVPGEGLGGSVVVRGAEGELTIPCYPSDALALAKRARVPIFVAGDVFSHVQPFSSLTSEEDQLGGGVAEWLERIDPADFSAGPPNDRLTEE